MVHPHHVGASVLLNAHTLLERASVRIGMHVADFGCGSTGHVIIPAAHAVGPEGRAYAVDVHREALRATEGRAKLSRIGNMHFVWSNIERVGGTDIPAASLDRGLVVSTLHLLRDHASAFRELWRLMKPNGLVLAVDWSATDAPLGPSAQARVERAVVVAAAEDAGFSTTETFDAGAYHYGCLFQKAA